MSILRRLIYILPSLAILLVFPALAAASSFSSPDVTSGLNGSGSPSIPAVPTTGASQLDGLVGSISQATPSGVSSLADLMSAPGNPLTAAPVAEPGPANNGDAKTLANATKTGTAAAAGGTPIRIEMSTTIVTTIEPQFPVTIGWADLAADRSAATRSSHRGFGPLPLNPGTLIGTFIGLLLSLGLAVCLKGARQAWQARA